MTNNFTPAKAGQQRNRLSKEEYADKMKAEKEAVYQMADETAKAIVSDPEKFKAFLDTQSRLDRYSAVNALLIFKQLPEASQLKNFDDWSKDNVKIQKGAKSISILEPVEYAKRDGTTGISYNVKKVFDVSQTNGKRPPAPTVNRDPKALITVMLDSSPVEVEATNELPYPNMAAFYNNEEQTLYVKRDVGDSVAVAQCVAQELGHAQLSINSDSYSRADMGFQAVCIGYMLCKKYGVDTQNFAINRIPEKLAGKEPKDIRYELSKTRNAMADIHSRVSDELYKKKQERSKDYERYEQRIRRRCKPGYFEIRVYNVPLRTAYRRHKPRSKAEIYHRPLYGERLQRLSAERIYRYCSYLAGFSCGAFETGRAGSKGNRPCY